MNPLAPSSKPAHAEVVVPIYKNVPLTLACLESVLSESGDCLGRLIAVNDASPDPAMAPALRELAARDSRLEVVTNERNLGFVHTCNRALALRRGDIVLLNSDTRVTDGWLAELIEVAYTDERTACVSPLSNNATICSVPNFCADTPADQVSIEAVRRAVAGLPRSSIAPTAVGFCLYLRGVVLDVVGAFDPVYSPGYNEENDWIMRAQAMGFVARRANRALVFHLGRASFDERRVALEEEHARILNRRYPHYLPQVRRFVGSLDGRIAAHAVRIESCGRMRVALDLRALGPNRVGSNVYAHRLAELLAASKEVELTVIERQPQGLERLGVRVLAGDDPIDDVEIIHKPSQVFDPSELALLYRSPAHVVLTYQDLIAHHAQAVWPSTEIAERYRAMGHLTVQAAQSVIAISESGRREIADELGLPTGEITVVPHAIETEPFDARRTERAELRQRKGVPARYFLCVGTDFPHKNLASVVAAHQLVRYEWKRADGPAPYLVLAGATCDVPNSFYRRLSASPAPEVLHFGEVDDELLRALYQGALALVFGSVYEGFGLPPLEAMAAGTPVIAMPLSAIVETCRDAALYPERLGPEGLADVMMSLARSPERRAERIAAGRAHVRGFTSARMLEGTLAAYRNAWRAPPERSLRARRFLLDGALEAHLRAPARSPASDHPSRSNGSMLARFTSLLRRLRAP